MFLQLGQFLLVSVERNMRKESLGWLFFVGEKVSLLSEECLSVFYVAKNGHMIVDNHVPVVVIVDSDLYA